jgi:hypothetical protein
MIAARNLLHFAGDVASGVLLYAFIRAFGGWLDSIGDVGE